MVTLERKMRTCRICGVTKIYNTRRFCYERRYRDNGTIWIQKRSECRVCHNEATRIRSAERQAQRVANRLSPSEEIEVMYENALPLHIGYLDLSVRARHMLILRLWKQMRKPTALKLSIKLGLTPTTIRYHLKKEKRGEPAGVSFRGKKDGGA